MRIQLSDFELPGHPAPGGDITYKAIAYDVNSGQLLEDENAIIHAYLVCGWREDDGAGVLVHGTRYAKVNGRNQWRVPRIISAPSDEEAGITVTRTEFHNVESLEGPYLRLVGCIETAEKPGLKQGFFYEGWFDGSGDWYPINLDDEGDTIVKASCAEILVCSDEGLSDSVHVYSLKDHKWAELHSGYAESWEVDEIIPAGELYLIRLLHSDGRRSDIPYYPGKK